MKAKLFIHYLQNLIWSIMRPATAVFIFILTLSPEPFALSQIPQGFNYQAIARDPSNGNPIPGASMQVKIGILSDTIANNMVWEELFNPVMTNKFGMFTIIVGTGVKQSGSAATFSAIDWTKTPLFLRTSIMYPDPGPFKVMGTSKLQSVPYSMVAGNLEGSVPLLSVKGNTTTMDSALFVVRNNTGQIVFAVYNEGVRIYVDNGVAKGATKGGFAIGSFDKSKGTSQPLFIVDPDSIRAYLDNNPVKTVKGGFAIGGFDRSKLTGNQQFFTVSDDSIRMYIDDNLLTKSRKGGFAIGSFDKSKGGNVNFLNVSTDSTGIINPSENRILWYPLKDAFLTGRVLVESKDSVGVNSFASGFESKAKGKYSQALGYKAIARGDYSTAIGKNAVAGNINSFAFGSGTQAINNGTYAFGSGAIASGAQSYAFGKTAIASGAQSYAIGSVGIDTFGIATGISTQAMGNYSFAIGMGAKATKAGAFSIGTGTNATGTFALSMGYGTVASGEFSTALGFESSATGHSSFASGEFSAAQGYSSVALGNSMAVGSASYAMGKGFWPNGPVTHDPLHPDPRLVGTLAWGNSSVAIGIGAVARSYSMIAIGQLNEEFIGDPSNWIPTDQLFVIGNGYQYLQIPQTNYWNIHKQNALTILKNGNVGIGTSTPASLLDVNGNINATSLNGVSFFMKYGNNGSVSGDTYCRGAEWGRVGACIAVKRLDNGDYISIYDVPNVAVSCLCAAF